MFVKVLSLLVSYLTNDTLFWNEVLGIFGLKGMIKGKEKWRK
jgi:hypothetical protein